MLRFLVLLSVIFGGWGCIPHKEKAVPNQPYKFQLTPSEVLEWAKGPKLESSADSFIWFWQPTLKDIQDYYKLNEDEARLKMAEIGAQINIGADQSDTLNREVYKINSKNWLQAFRQFVESSSPKIQDYFADFICYQETDESDCLASAKKDAQFRMPTTCDELTEAPFNRSASVASRCTDLLIPMMGLELPDQNSTTCFDSSTPVFSQQNKMDYLNYFNQGRSNEQKLSLSEVESFMQKLYSFKLEYFCRSIKTDSFQNKLDAILNRSIRAVEFIDPNLPASEMPSDDSYLRWLQPIANMSKIQISFKPETGVQVDIRLQRKGPSGDTIPYRSARKDEIHSIKGPFFDVELGTYCIEFIMNEFSALKEDPATPNFYYKVKLSIQNRIAGRYYLGDITQYDMKNNELRKGKVKLYFKYQLEDLSEYELFYYQLFTWMPGF